MGKVHAVVARSTFPSQNVQNTPFSDHFWRFRCRKSGRHCGKRLFPAVVSLAVAAAAAAHRQQPAVALTWSQGYASLLRHEVATLR